MKRILTSIFALLVAVTFISLSANAQTAAVKGPHGGEISTYHVINYVVEMVAKSGSVEFYILDKENKNAKLTVAAATAEIIVDYDGVVPADKITKTITSKNKFVATFSTDHKPNFYAISTNFNGEIIQARFVVPHTK